MKLPSEYRINTKYPQIGGLKAEELDELQIQGRLERHCKCRSAGAWFLLTDGIASSDAIGNHHPL
jgi:hypothetical protein